MHCKTIDEKDLAWVETDMGGQRMKNLEMLQFIAINCYFFSLTLKYDKGTYH